MSLKSLLIDAVRVVIPLGLLAAGAAGFAAISQREKPAARPQAEEQPLLVQTIPVTAHGSEIDLQADGLVIPYREVLLAAEVSGRVTFKSPECRSGQVVHKGTLLFEIDRETYQLEVDRLQSELTQAEANVNELDIERQNTSRLVELAEEQLALQQRQTERIISLSKRNVSTEADLEDARRSELAAQNSLITLNNQAVLIDARRATQVRAKELAMVKLRQAQLDLQRTRVVAPLDGVVIVDGIEENSYVQMGAALVTLEDTSAVEVRCNLRMEELQWILRQPQTSGSAGSATTMQGYRLPETPVTVRYNIGKRGYDWSGTLISYDGLGLDERTRTVPVRVKVSEPRRMAENDTDGTHRGPPALVRGMFVQVIVHAKPQAELLEIPENAIQPGNMVWRALEGKLEILPVPIAQVHDGTVLIDSLGSKLSAGDRLVVTPLAAPYDGLAVREEAAE